ncbi:hypothetical protein, partial [Parendozoicomonas sp. Alg238-R29]|uniref:hypothetical protein n=1 Tax=Parendozoicomonas sp. Alg238-R29 TaxID=2993446 RepID=UPI00248D42AC
QSDQAPAYIQAGKSVEQVRTELFEQLTRQQPTIDNSLTPQQHHQPNNTDTGHAPKLDVQALYQKRNKHSYQ